MPKPRNEWDARIRRASRLAESHPFAAEILKFYSSVAEFQKTLYESYKPGKAGLRDPLNLARLGDFGAFVKLVERTGPPRLAASAPDLRPEVLLPAFWQSADGLSDHEIFYARAFLQPYAEYLASDSPIQSGEPLCPACGRRPQLAILREEGHGAKRSLLCSLCSTEWDYLRVICASCSEERFEQLPVYTAPEFEHVRVEACDSCKTYIKSIDLTKNGLAIPIVDELATTPLDLWAAEQGYTKLELNLLRM